MAVHLNRFPTLGAIALLLSGLSLPAAAHNGKTAHAIPLSNITIDGRLDDWPEEMVVYPISEVLKTWGFEYIGLDSPDDLTARFRVGYEPARGYLYLAIEVQDESLVARGGWDSDVCEVYLAGSHAGAGTPEQYCFAPGDINPYGFSTNPGMSAGQDISKSHVEVAFTRRGNLTTYEWSVEVFDVYPSQKTDLSFGKAIGFDLSIVDKDADGSYSWMSWTPKGGKVRNASLLGDLVMVEHYTDIGSIAGQIVNRDRGAPIRGARVEVSQEGKPALVAFSDSAGVYRQHLLQGTYSVRAFSRGIREAVVQRGVEIAVNRETAMDFSLEDRGTCFFVDDDALDEGDGSVAHPFRTIQEALDATSEGDTVRVLAGIYREPIVLLSGVNLLGAGPDSTFLDGEGKRGVVQIADVENVVLEGFAIVRGQGRVGQSVTGEYQSPFGGISVYNARHVRIADNLISGNTSAESGGGIVCAFNVDSTVVIAHNLIAGNTTTGSGAPGGGGLYFGQGSQAVVHHNTVVYNEAAGDGGGILCEGSNPYIHDNIIAHNINGGIVSRFSPYISVRQAEPGPLLAHNDVWNNTDYDYSGLDPGEGDVAVDPEFLASEQGDFRLSRDSPCRKAGTTGKVGADVERLGGEQGLRAAIPPRPLVEQFRNLPSPPSSPVIRKVKYLSLTLPPAHQLRVDTFQVQIRPLDLGLLDRTEKLYDRFNGLPSNNVKVVAPAPGGSIWVGTDRGAARYDGLWTYLDTLRGLPGNQVGVILPARDGAVWIATSGGLARYRDGQVQTVSKEQFWNLVEDPAGGFWLGGRRTAFLDTVWTYLSLTDSTGGLTYQADPRLAGQRGEDWLLVYGTSFSGILRYSPSQSEAYELPYLSSSRVQRLLQAADGKLWMGFLEIGPNIPSASTFPADMTLGFLDAAVARLHTYRLPEGWRQWNISTSRTWDYSILQDRTDLLWVFGDKTILQFDGQHWSGVKDVEFVSADAALDQEGNFWFGHYNRGLVQYGPQTWTTYKGKERLEGKRVTCIVEDRSGNLWLGSENGLSRRNTDGTWTQLAVTDTLVTDLLVDQQGQIWVATDRGVHRHDGRQWKSYTVKDGLPDTVVTALAEGTDGRIWAGTGNGLFWYDGQRWQNMPVSAWRLDEGRNPNSINRLYPDLEGRLWIGTNGGLYGYDQGKVQDYFEVFYPGREVDLDSLFTLKRPEEIQQTLKAMLKEEMDMAWFLDKVQPSWYWYYGGSPDPAWQRVTRAYAQLVKEDADFRTLSRRAAEEGYVVQRMFYGYESEAKPEGKALAFVGGASIKVIFAGREGDLWITSSDGLFIRSDSTWTHYQQAAMPFAGMVTGTATDQEGNLWLATDQGAVRYDGQHWTPFDAADGLADNQVNDILEDHEGNIWFATAKGVTRYRPDKRPPQTRITHGPEGTVGYGTSTLTFEFEGGDWEWEQRGLVFSYALMKEGREPQEEDWSAWSDRTFVQMPPPGDGHFAFYVRARDKALNVDPTPAIHSFYIAPPLWEVLWFQTSVGFGLLLIVFSSGYAISRRRDQLRAERALMQDMEAELQKAHDLQMGLMPKEAPQIAGFEFAGRCFTANHVGGDFFKYYRRPHQHFLGVLADVTGHAMEAAVPLLMFSGILESQVELGGSIEELFGRLNRSLHRTLPEHTFVCLAMGELDPASRLFRFSNSGCPYPYHYRAATGEVVELQVDAYPLGVRPDTAYRVIEVQLEPGDRVAFCSDGIIEATNASGEMFGFERTSEVIRKGCEEDLSPEALLERIMVEVKGFRGDTPQGDDQTIVVLKVEK